MIGFLYIEDTIAGEVDFQVIDLTMGAIGGKLRPYKAYEKYRGKIQTAYEIKGVANADDLDLKIVLDDNAVVEAMGGICITESKEFQEIYVDAAGIDFDLIDFN